jgi:hypothetical protein
MTHLPSNFCECKPTLNYTETGKVLYALPLLPLQCSSAKLKLKGALDVVGNFRYCEDTYTNPF